ncbi:M23 family metallopeptidase [Leptolyngbya sp. FACHB-36]|uniref:M23 family metallopeptidase n=1 Tax=Leptolyngbya sp. FACHB-36 TaxID=2692808 RepID=UPI00168023EE|nr:M23 family metallopeptidase [Leptolyngbya sp. FACHB-36]MBD2019351.1 M23 family metallopeptidase [Leptolyngbya sp. FACHB-36]
MVLTIAPYNPKSKLSDVAPGESAHPAGAGTIRFDLRILTRYGAVIIDFGQLTDLLSWNDTLSTEGASGTWTLKMRASLCNEALLKKLHPGMVVEAYCARNDNPLIGVVRDPSTISRIDSTPPLPELAQTVIAPTSIASAAPTTSSASAGNLGAAETDTAFYQKLTQVAGRLGMNPEHLLTAMLYESAGTLSPSIRGPHVPGDGQAVGLIQFMPSTARGLGTTDSALASMNRVQQLDYVEKYFQPYKGRYSNFYSVYATIHAGNPTANPNGSDGYRTTGQAASEAQSRFSSKARNLLQGAGVNAATTTPISPSPSQTPTPTPQITPIVGPTVKPSEDPYLDKCPYLLLRGVITDYGRSTGDGTSLTVTGESYGKIYKDAFVLTDLNAPELASTSLEVRNSTIVPLGVSLIYYRLLREWVEGFWGQTTGWEARTRPIPFPPNYLTRINNEGSVWANLQFLAIEGFFHIFVDHTGAIVWEKLPWSSRSQSLIAGRNWEDLPLLEMPSWKISEWHDRLSEQGVTNFIRCVPTQQGMSGGQDPVAQPGLIYNLGSIRQYGGPTKRELLFPVGTGGDQYYTSEPRRKQQATINSFTALCSLESIRWYDRPTQRVGVTARGEAAWRIHTRIKIAEDWHCPDAKPAEYYVIARTHQLDFTRGSWATNLDMVRDRRNRYLGIGVGEVPVVTGTGNTVQSVLHEFGGGKFKLQGIAADQQRSEIERQIAKAKADRQSQILGLPTQPAKPAVDASRFTTAKGFSLSGQKVSSLKQFVAPDLKGQISVAEVPAIQVSLVPDEYFWFDRLSGKVVAIGNDPVAWAKQNVVPRLGEESKAVTVIPPKSPTGITAPTGPAAPFTPVDRIYVSRLYDESPPLAWDFTLARGGTAFNDQVITPVPSPISGTVRFAGAKGGYGNAVEIIGSDGVIWFMAHMTSISVSQGQQVTRGQTISIQGWTGSVSPKNEDGTHIHCEIGNNSVPRLPRETTRPLLADYFRFVSGGKSPTYVGGSGF